MHSLPPFGVEAPDFTLPDPEGRDVSLRGFRGRPVVLLFYCYDFGSI